MSQYARVPLSAIADDRLSPRQFKVLCALYSFADKDGHCHPKRAQLSERCGIAENHISVATAELVDLGWLEKIGNGGRSSAMNYIVKTHPKSGQENNAETRTESGLVSDKETRPKSGLKPVPNRDRKEQENPSQIGTQTRPKSGQAPRPKLGQGIQQTISTDQEHITTPPVVPPQNSQANSAAKKSRLSPELSDACKRTWESYAMAYANRYGIEPVKNAKTAGQVVQFVKRIGMEDAPHVAAHYLTSSARWYVTIGHSTDAMLKDAEKLRMEWATNRRITSESARQADATQSNFSAAEQAKAILAGRRATV